MRASVRDVRFLPRALGSLARVTASVLGMLVAVGLVVVGPSVGQSVARADVPGASGDFVPLSPPVPVLDTRTGLGAPSGVRSAGVTTTFPVTGVGGIPAAGNVQAVMLNVTTSGQTARTFVQIWAEGTSKSIVSALVAQPASPGAKRERSNAAIVPVGESGKLNISSTNGSTHLIVNIQGYFSNSAGSGAGSFVPVTQKRIVDTRTGLGAPGAAIGPGASLSVNLVGGPIPAGAKAAFLNVSASQATAEGWLSVAPSGVTSSVNVLGYVAVGSSNNGAAIPLGTNGTVTFVNHSTGSVHLVLDALGYFTGTTTSGGKLRTQNERLVGTTTGVLMAPNSTMDIPVAGAVGLPTRGVAGVAANFMVLNPQSTGFLRVWPTGESEPVDTSSTLFPFVDQERDSMGIVKPGADGSIRVRNSSSGTIELVVDMQGWFADPIPPVPVTQSSPTSVMQASPVVGVPDTPIEYSYVDNIGQLHFGHQPDPGAFSSVQWTPLPGANQFRFTGTPGLAEQADGRLQIVGQTVDSNLSAITETTKNPLEWGPWVGVGGSMASQPAIARLSDGRLVVLAVDADGRLWVLQQSAANGAYLPWRLLGMTGLVGTPTAVSTGSSIRVFARDTAGALRTAVYSNGVLTGQTSLGGSGLTGTAAVAVSPGQLLRVFVRGGDGSILTQMQNDLGVFPGVWDTVAGFSAAGSPTALLSPTTGRTVLLARASDGSIFHTSETAQGSGQWRDWINSGTVSATDPTSFAYTDGGEHWAFTWRDSDQRAFVTTVDETSAAALDADGGSSLPIFTNHRLPSPTS